MSKATTELTRKRRQETQDHDVEKMGGQKTHRVNLGIALLHLRCIPGQGLSQDDIAAWAGCTHSAIHQIEKRALRRLRNRLQFIKDQRLRDMIESYFNQRESAQRRPIH